MAPEGRNSMERFSRNFGLPASTLTITSLRMVFHLLGIRNSSGLLPEKFDLPDYPGVQLLGEGAVIPAAPTEDAYLRDAYLLRDPSAEAFEAPKSLFEYLEIHRRMQPKIQFPQTKKKDAEVRMYLGSLAAHLLAVGWKNESIIDLVRKKNRTFSTPLNDEEIQAITKTAPLFEIPASPSDIRPESDNAHAKLMECLAEKQVLWNPNAGKHGKAWTLDGSRWAYDDLDIALSEIYERSVTHLIGAAASSSGSQRDKLLGYAIDSGNTKKRRDVLEAFRNLSRLRIGREAFDQSPFQLNLANGTRDFLADTFYPSFRGDLHTKMAPVNYDPKAKCPRWLDFLSKITNGNADHMQLLQKAVGYCLIEGNTLRVMFILFGKGANGKSTFLHVVQTLLGDYSKATSIQNFSNKTAIRNGIARLAGARLVVVDEAEGDEGDF